MNRALRAATVGVLLFTPVALSACSAGQVNQTASQVRDKVGPTAHVGELELRAVKLAYPTSGSYSAGDDAELQMAVVNSGSEDDALIGITGPFERVRVTGSPTGTQAPSTTTAAPTTPSTSGGAPNIPIRADSSLFLGQNGPTVTLVGLREGLTPAQTVQLTFAFERAGEITMQVPVAVPSREIPRGDAFDFEHQPEQGNEPGNQVAGGTPGGGHG